MNIKAAMVIIIYNLYMKLKKCSFYIRTENRLFELERNVRLCQGGCFVMTGMLFINTTSGSDSTHQFGWCMATNNIQLTNEVCTACFEIIKSTDKSEFAFLRRNTPGVLNDENSTLPKLGALCNLTYSCIS